MFNEVGTKTAAKITSTNIDCMDYMNVCNSNSLFFNPTSEEEIIRIVKQLKNTNSTSVDNICQHIIKKTIYAVARPLKHIINLSLTTGKVPNQLKVAKIVPIFKTGDPYDISNYRPISLLPCFSKLLEKIVYIRLYKFLERNNIFYEHQYGFRPNHSTDHALIDFYDTVCNALHSKKFTIGLFLDLSKAFDVMDHSILLSKLRRYGIRGIPYSWFHDYLSNRNHCTLYKTCISEECIIKTGIPQGSILGPLLFLLYVNDFHYVSNFSTSFNMQMILV